MSQLICWLLELENKRDGEGEQLKLFFYAYSSSSNTTWWMDDLPIWPPSNQGIAIDCGESSRDKRRWRRRRNRRWQTIAAAGEEQQKFRWMWTSESVKWIYRWIGLAYAVHCLSHFQFMQSRDTYKAAMPVDSGSRSTIHHGWKSGGEKPWPWLQLEWICNEVSPSVPLWCWITIQLFATFENITI